MNQSAARAAQRRLAFFERYLTVWLFVCMIASVVLGKGPQLDNRITWH
ncbi:MAG: hypothetical protein AAB466_00715 [Verrucomicrobiota bacterium]